MTLVIEEDQDSLKSENSFIQRMQKIKRSTSLKLS